MIRSGSTSALVLGASAIGVLLFARADGLARPQQVDTPQVRGEFRGVLRVERFDISPPLTELVKFGVTARPEEEDRDDDRPTGLQGPPGPQSVDPAVQREIGVGEMPSPTQSFDGASNTCNCSPPDPNAAVGPNHVVEMTNLSFQVFNKTGTSLFGPAANNTLWAGFGGPCQVENQGDPIVLYDRRADRWLLSQFTAAGPTFFNCVALSQTGDPTGSYYRWAFTTGSNFPDYPKYGIWRDAYYIATREFAGGTTFVGVGAYGLNRAQMLAGNPLPTVLAFLAPPTPAYVVGDGLLPADIDGNVPPPITRDEYFIGSEDDGGGFGAPSDALSLWKFHADFSTPANSSFTLVNTLSAAPFDSILGLCGGTRNCIPQPGTANRVDHQGYRQRVLHRAAYRNFGSYESIVTNQSVEASTNVSGVRWYEIRSPSSSPIIYQQGTYSPDSTHRWFGSIAEDHNGNMALGFSVSDGVSVFPGLRYTGRLVGDALGTMGQGEATLINGAGSQTVSQRWGDYSSMAIDPSDDCTFWFTSEYFATTSSNGWKTRIGAFTFPGCVFTGFAEPVVPGTTVTAAQITELQTRIAAGHTARGISAAIFSAVLPGTTIQASHITQLRTGLDAIYTNDGRTHAAYTDSPLSAGTVIKAVHINELRTFLLNVE